jgi:LPS O-antigen subunit length determinant protein (WzzB/FepE family)
LAAKSMKIVMEKHADVRSLVPSQAMTIQLHLLVGLLLSAGFLIPGLLR